jgi:hypothetical protein
MEIIFEVDIGIHKWIKGWGEAAPVSICPDALRAGVYKCSVKVYDFDR